MSIIDKFQPFITRLKSSKHKLPTEKYYPVVLALFVGYILSDLGILYFRPTMLPTDAPPLRPQRQIRTKMHNLAEYRIITDRNIFNEDGLIPPPLGATDSGNNLDRPAVPSQLPIQLLGTIVHFNPKMSIATVSLTSKNLSSSYKVDEEIEGLARVTKIERKKLTFVNLSNRILEYVEIPEDAVFNFGLQAIAAPTSGGGLIEQKGRFDFSIKRSDLESLTQNLSSLLQQARMEPVFSPDGIGVEGFRFATIQPGSIYEKLGFKVGDMIRSVNREPVNSPSKAMEMYNVLKSSNTVQLGVERDGREETFNYSIQ